MCKGTRLQSRDGFMLFSVSWTNPGTWPSLKDPSVFKTPMRPAMSSVWPTQDLEAPTTKGASAVCEDLKTSLIPWISIRSPKDVPVDSVRPVGVTQNRKMNSPVPCASKKLKTFVHHKKSFGHHNYEDSLDFRG